MEPAPGQTLPTASARQISATVNRRNQRQTEHRQQKKGGQRIDLEMETAARHRPGGDHRFGVSSDEDPNRSNEPQKGPRDCAALAGDLARARP